MTIGIFELGDTWNNGSTTFKAISMDVTDSNSAAGSLLLDLLIGGFSRFTVHKSGQVRGIDGSASAPTYSNIGDTNTGVYFPSGDEIGFASSGQERLRVTSAGDVGIGTSSPDTLFHIRGIQGDGKFEATANNPADLTLASNRADASVVGGRILFDWGGTTVARIQFDNGADTVNKDDGEIAFYTAAEGTPTEAMRIKSSGGLNLSSLPTSASGLSSGDVWNDSGTLKIVT